MFRRHADVLLFALAIAAATPAMGASLNLHAAPQDSHAAQVRTMAAAAADEIEAFFARPFPAKINFDLAADRAAFDKALPAQLEMGPTKCWMVGLGVADKMVLLSPGAWKDQACEHDPADTQALKRLIAHELVHVYHGQHNASGDFRGVEDMDWFIEGVAVHVSGQLTPARLDRARAALAAGKGPQKLSEVWTGPDRYGFAGSLARHIDQTWGRDVLFQLLSAGGTAKALAVLKTDEAALLAGWRKALSQAPKS